MKKIISSVMLFAATAMAFVSCQKQENLIPEASQEVTLAFVSEKPAFDDDTKTEWTGNGIQWSAGDRISVAYTVNGKWQNAAGDADGDAKLYKSEKLEESATTAQFNVSANFKGTVQGDHKFYGVYPAPSETGFANAPVADITIPSIQSPKVDSFDSAADFMTGVSVGNITTRPASSETISMKWTRLVAHANITLKSIKGITADERLASIVLTAQDGANLVGRQKINLLTNVVEKNNEASNVLELLGGELSIDSKGNVEFWACVLPETLTSLTVVVETDKASYTREIRGISKTFKQNARNTLTIKMDEAVRVAKAAESWVLVSPSDGIAEGTYVLVASTATQTGALTNANGTSSAPKFETSISVENNLLYGVTEFVQFDISGSEGNWVLNVAGDSSKWLYCTNTNNGVRVGTNSDKTWTISAHTDNEDAFAFKHNGQSRYLGVYGNQDWRCYSALNASNYTNATGSSKIYLYKKTSGTVAPDTTPKIVVSDSQKTISADGGELSFSYTLKNITGQDVTATETSDFISIKSASNGVVKVEVAANNTTSQRTATVTLACGKAESKTLTITQEAKVVNKSISEILKLANGTALMTEGLVMAKYARGVLISDETGTILVYNSSGVEAEIGDKVSVEGTMGSYSNMPQITNPTVKKISTGNKVTYPSVTELNGTGMDALLSAKSVSYIQYSGTLTVNGNYYNVAVDGAATAIGSIQYPIQSIAGLNGKKVKVTGYFVGVSSSKYINTMAVSVEETDDLGNEGGEEPEPEQPSNPNQDKVAIINVANVNAAKTMGNGTYGDYDGIEVAVTIDGLPCKAKDICANQKDGNIKMAAKQFVQLRKGTGSVYNTQGKVKSVKVWTHPQMDNGDFMYIGTNQNPSTQTTISKTTESIKLTDNNGNSVLTQLNVYDVQLDGSNSYFKIQSSKALWIYKVEVTYQD